MGICSGRYATFPGWVALLLCWAMAQAHGQGLWTMTGQMVEGRRQTAATLLDDGRVLVVGGNVSCNPSCYTDNTAELYSPVTGTWSATSPLHTPRFNHVTLKLPDGRVLAAGGYVTPGVLTAACEIFDPATGNWTPHGKSEHAQTVSPGCRPG